MPRFRVNRGFHYHKGKKYGPSEWAGDTFTADRVGKVLLDNGKITAMDVAETPEETTKKNVMESTFSAVAVKRDRGGWWDVYNTVTGLRINDRAMKEEEALVLSNNKVADAPPAGNPNGESSEEGEEDEKTEEDE